jgi:Zn-dependent protease/CBS domain-containing protein
MEMNANIKLGKILGIPIGLHFSWFLVFALVIFSLSTGYFPQKYPMQSNGLYVLLAAVTTLGFFGSVLLHELGHSVIALRNNIPVKGITLFIFGGVAQIKREPQTPGAEFRIAIAGPLVSLALAGIFGALAALEAQFPLLAAPSSYLMPLNLTLALFNMIPGLPLDGGRVLRAIVWKLSGSQVRATRIASYGGQAVAFGFIGWGVFNIFTGQFTNGMWMMLIGWFLQSAAASASSQADLQEKLRGVTVEQAMSQECTSVPALTPLNQLVQERVLQRGNACFLVTDYEGQLRGILTLQDITRIPQIRWRFSTAEQAMTPLNGLPQVDAGEEILEALQQMDEVGAHHATVVQFNRQIGLISRDQVMRYLRLRTQLGM